MSIKGRDRDGTRPGDASLPADVPSRLTSRNSSIFSRKTTRRHSSQVGLIPVTDSLSERESTSFLSAFQNNPIFEQQIDCIHTYSWPGTTTDHEHGRTPFLQSTPYRPGPCQDDQQTNGGGNPSKAWYIFNRETRRWTWKWFFSMEVYRSTVGSTTNLHRCFIVRL